MAHLLDRPGVGLAVGGDAVVAGDHLVIAVHVEQVDDDRRAVDRRMFARAAAELTTIILTCVAGYLCFQARYRTKDI